MRPPRLRAPTHGHSARDMLSVSMWIVFKLCEQLFEKDARALVAHRTLAYLVGVVSADTTAYPDPTASRAPPIRTPAASDRRRLRFFMEPRIT